MTCRSTLRRAACAFAAAVLAAAVLAGCATAPLPGAASLASQPPTLTPGVTTQAAVQRALGKANVTRFDSGYEVWVYDYTGRLPPFVGMVPGLGLVAGAVDAVTRERELAILFDRDGIVRKVRMRETASQVDRLLAPR